VLRTVTKIDAIETTDPIQNAVTAQYGMPAAVVASVTFCRKYGVKFATLTPVLLRFSDSGCWLVSAQFSAQAARSRRGGAGASRRGAPPGGAPL